MPEEQEEKSPETLESKLCHALTKLELSDNTIGYEAVRSMGPFLRFDTLLKLDLQNVRMVDRALQMLVRSGWGDIQFRFRRKL